jgi:hypothetical protein
VRWRAKACKDEWTVYFRLSPKAESAMNKQPYTSVPLSLHNPCIGICCFACCCYPLLNGQLHTSVLPVHNCAVLLSPQPSSHRCWRLLHCCLDGRHPRAPVTSSGDEVCCGSSQHMCLSAGSNDQLAHTARAGPFSAVTAVIQQSHKTHSTGVVLVP